MIGKIAKSFKIQDFSHLENRKEIFASFYAYLLNNLNNTEMVTIVDKISNNTWNKNIIFADIVEKKAIEEEKKKPQKN